MCFCTGHEGGGVVESVGEGVTSVSPGEILNNSDEKYEGDKFLTFQGTM